ncbi:hypothetical protein [Pseudogracilibacillus auburnensis]|uniref:hypothetical protein n=1 Tax=Pseudogracilibacillus auburnensis TaxID=1494959 RepID=UPI001A96FFE7|nr:hypothetical protein [Pseudogracilibacillus auburnensis]MBO1003155.1 hypothetical protein [Pseudogracilibacillus auburnensis]
MEKVKLTQEQADAIQIRIDRNARDDMMDYHASGWTGRSNTCLNSLSASELARALYVDNGYEVEPNIKIGDTVFVSWLNREGEFYKVEDVLTNGKIVIDSKTYDKPSMDIVRLATPEEIFWNDNDRGVWEIREDDTLEYLGDPLIVDSFDSEDVCFKRNKNYPEKYTESFDFVKEHFKVFCFAEDRKDV